MQIRVLASISIFVVGAAHADSTGDASAEIAKCAGIADSAARLKCFDAAAPRANGAAGQPAREAPGRAEGFGFSAPEPMTREEDFGKPAPLPKLTQITATVVELARSARGRPIFILDNGQVWRQIDGDDANVLDLRPGKTMKVVIEMSRVQRLIGAPPATRARRESRHCAKATPAKRASRSSGSSRPAKRMPPLTSASPMHAPASRTAGRRSPRSIARSRSSRAICARS